MDYREAMRWKIQMLAAAGVLLGGSDAQAVPAAELKDRYQTIIERNAFGLKPPTPPATNNIAPPEEKPKVEVFLTGITSIGYPKMPKQAYFYTREPGKKEITYYALTEGALKDGIEVMNIDADKRKVKIKMENAETLLSFETHGVPIAATAATGRPLPGVPGGMEIPVPGRSTHYNPPGVQPLPTPGNATTTYDANGQPVYNQAAIGGAQPMSSVNRGSTGLRQIPSRRIRGGGGNTYGNGVNPPGFGGIQNDAAGQQQVNDPAEEYVRAHLNEVARQREQPNIPAPPLPQMPQMQQ